MMEEAEERGSKAITFKQAYAIKMSDADFNKLSVFINREYGIKLPYAKKTMLQCRLQKRLSSLNMSNFTDYSDYIFSPEGKEKELIHMVDMVTTNKTDFFREPAHFVFMQDRVLPEFIQETGNRKLKAWSAGCSSGEEVYTLAIVLQEFLKNYSGYDYSILGTDISTRILSRAVNAIYSMERIANIPLDLKKKYFLKSKDAGNPTVRVVKELRSKARYQRLNFMDDVYDISDMHDIVFCRNVLIYFERDIQEKVINRLCQKLRYGGYFFLGHSESIMGMKVPLKQLKPTIFQKI
jgi:chemotaxis protein methyltransferase CheR